MKDSLKNKEQNTESAKINNLFLEDSMELMKARDLRVQRNSQHLFMLNKLKTKVKRKLLNLKTLTSYYLNQLLKKILQLK